MLSDSDNNANNLCTESVFDAGIWCTETFDIQLNWCYVVFNSVMAWCYVVFCISFTWSLKKYEKHKRMITIIYKDVGIFLFVMDCVSDIFIGIKHYLRGDFWWAIITLFFTFVPMLLVTIGHIRYGTLECKDSMAAIICFPIVPFGWLVLDVVAFINSDNPYDINSNTIHNAEVVRRRRLAAYFAKTAKIIKFYEATLESYPQAGFQLFIVFQYIKNGDSIDAWQWVAISLSLGALAFSVSTGYLNDEASGSSKAIYFIFGILSVSSRYVVCCVYSMYSPPMWLVPYCTEMLTSIAVRMCFQLDKAGIIEQGYCAGPLILMMKEAYDGFTLNGMLTSTVNLAFAIGAFFLVDQQSVLIVAVTLAIISWVSNIMFTTIPCFKGVRKDWSRELHTEEIQSDAEDIHPNPEETQPNPTEIQSDTDSKETQSCTEETYSNGEEIQHNTDEIQFDTEDSQPCTNETQTYSHTTQPDSDETLLNTKKTQIDTEKNHIFSSNIKLHSVEIHLEAQVSQSNADELQIYEENTQFDSGEPQSNLMETRPDEEETQTIVEVTHL